MDDLNLTSTGTGPTAPEPPTPATDDALLTDDLLVEEISIDGMCGVY